MKKIIRVTSSLLKILAIIFIIDVSIYHFEGKLITVKYGNVEDFAFHTKLQTVESVVDSLNIKLEGLDEINYNMGDLTTDKMDIVIDIIREQEEILYDEEDFTSSTEISYKVPLFRTEVIVSGQSKITENTFLSVFKNGDVVSRKLIASEVTQNRVDEVIGVGRGNAVQFTGTLTGYSVQCPGCTGALYYPSYASGKKKWHRVNTEKIYFNYQKDKIETELCDTCYYIMAADKKIPGGTIIDLTLPANSKIEEKTIRAIVLDVGSAIQGKTGDLLFKQDIDTFTEGRLRNVIFKIYRWGWWGSYAN